jgi:lysophospholipase L1-like esterase
VSSTDPPPTAAGTAGLVVLGFFTAVAAGTLALFTIGDFAAVAVFVSIFGGALVTARTHRRGPAQGVFAALAVVLMGSIAITGYGAAQILAVVASPGTGTAAPADQADLAAAESKLDGSAESSAFRIELTEAEVNAVLQDALSTGNNPLARVTIDITNATGDPGRVDFVGMFKNGSLEAAGTLSAEVVAGSLQLEILEVDVGIFSMPGVAQGAVEDVITDLADLEAALSAEGADVQSIVIGDDRAVITGTQRDGAAIDPFAVLAALGEGADLSAGGVPVEAQFPSGRLSGTSAPGDRYYVAIGDSLAANVGVEDPAVGYVSRFHTQLERVDATAYGLANFGISGETSGTLLHGGQLDEAVAFAAANDVAYVTIDIGANDLLGHLASADCSADIDAPACTDRINITLVAYSRNIDSIFERVDAAIPGATVVVLTTYNPFSFGFEGELYFEARSNEILGELNRIAASAADSFGFLVADGSTPMRGTATSTTHMVDVPPDIHPNALGYDVLTGALVAAIGR